MQLKLENYLLKLLASCNHHSILFPPITRYNFFKINQISTFQKEFTLKIQYNIPFIDY